MKVTGPTLRVVSIGGAGADSARGARVCVCMCVLTGNTLKERDCKAEEEGLVEEKVSIIAEVDEGKKNKQEEERKLWAENAELTHLYI